MTGMKESSFLLPGMAHGGKVNAGAPVAPGLFADTAGEGGADEGLSPVQEVVSADMGSGERTFSSLSLLLLNCLQLKIISMSKRCRGSERVTQEVSLWCVDNFELKVTETLWAQAPPSPYPQLPRRI